MSEPRTCYLPNITALSCTGVDRLGRAEVLRRRGANIVVSDMTELGGGR